jgi:hypothetical protein
MTDRLTDIFIIEKIYEDSGVKYFDENIRKILEDVINELYSSHQGLIFKLRINHIDRAIFKYRLAKEQRKIYNTKQYFKSCILSAIIETGLDELEPL